MTLLIHGAAAAGASVVVNYCTQELDAEEVELLAFLPVGVRVNRHDAGNVWQGIDVAAPGTSNVLLTGIGQRHLKANATVMGH